MSATARRGWRVPVVAFITGVFIATVVLTRDYTVGDDVLAALVAGEISSINAQASDFSSLPTPRARASDPDVDNARCFELCAILRAGVDARTRIGALELRSSARAALAATKLSLALWARVFSPATNAITEGVVRGTRAGGRRLAVIVRETEPRVLAQWVLACVGAAYVYHLCWRFVKHLKRARYRNKLRFFIIRMRLRASRRVRTALEPYARVYRRVASAGTAVKRRYSLVVRGIRSKSRLAANALPHALFLVVGMGVFRVMPRYARNMVRKREILATIALLVPMFRTMLAVESEDMALVEKWLRFWASCAPFMIAVDFPFIFYGVRWFFPWWPEVLVLFTMWLNSRLTRGSQIILEFSTPLVSRAMAYLNESSGTTGKISILLRRSVRQALQISVIVIRFRSRRASEALRLVLDNMSIPLVMCTVFFFTPGLMTIYGCDMAGLVVPFAFTVDGLLKYAQLKAQPQQPSRAQARKDLEKLHEDKLRNWLTYWLAHAMIWSLSQELSKSALGWFPLWRHTQLAGIYWLQVFGGSQLITARMQGIKQSILEDHQKALKAAISADLDASEVEELAKLKKTLDASRPSVETTLDETSIDDKKDDSKPTDTDGDVDAETITKLDVGITAETVRKRTPTDANGSN